MRVDNRFETLDKAALQQALLAMGVCPTCRNDLRPVAFLDSVWGCPRPRCSGTWFLPDYKPAPAASRKGEGER